MKKDALPDENGIVGFNYLNWLKWLTMTPKFHESFFLIEYNIDFIRNWRGNLVFQYNICILFA